MLPEQSGVPDERRTYEYDAFISYRRKDASHIAHWIRRRLQHFRMPPVVLAALSEVKQQLHARRPRIWLDKAYEKASTDFLANKILPALDASEHLLVLVTPSSFETIAGTNGEALPNWQLREIDHFAGPMNIASSRRAIHVALAPQAKDDLFPGRLEERDRWDWIDLRRFTRLRARTFSEQLDDGVVKLVAALYDVPDRFLPELRREEARLRLRLVGSIAGAAIVVALALGLLGTFAWQQQREAARQRDQAVSRLLASEAFRLAPSDPSRASMLFMTSLNVLETPIAHSGLFQIVQKDPHVAMRLMPVPAVPTALALDAAGRHAAIGLENGDALAWTPPEEPSSAGELPTPLRGNGVALIAIAIGEGGRRIVGIDQKGNRLEWSLDQPGAKAAITPVFGGKEIATSFDGASLISFDHQGIAVAAATYSGLFVWRAETGAKRIEADERDQAAGPIALSPDGRYFAFALGGDKAAEIPLRVIDLQGSEPPRSLLPRPGPPAAITSVAFDPTGRFLAVGTQDAGVRVLAIEKTLRPLRDLSAAAPGTRMNAGNEIEHIRLGAGGSYVAALHQHRWRLWHVASGTPLGGPIAAAQPLAAYDATRGRFLMVPQNNVVHVVDHSLKALRHIACFNASGDLPEDEWRAFAGDLPYALSRACSTR
jgi:hypothetical protein